MIDKKLFEFQGVSAAMAFLALLSLAQAVATVGQAYGLTLALVEIWKLHALASIVIPAGIFAAAFVVRQLCEVAKKSVATHCADRIVRDLRPRVQAKLFDAGPAAMSRRGTGATVTMLLDGLDQTKTYVQTIMPKMLDMTIVPVVILVVVWYENWLAGLVLLIVFPLLMFFMAILGIVARDKSDRQYGEFQNLNNRFVDTILGLPTLKMLGVSDDYEDEIYGVSERFRRRTMSVIMVAMSSSFALDFFTTLSIAVVAVFLGVNLINASVALLPALFVLILAPEYFLPIRQFGNDYHATLNGKNALADITSLLDAPDPARDDDFEMGRWDSDSDLSLAHVGFSYEVRDEDSSRNDAHGRASGRRGRSGSDEDTGAQTPEHSHALDDICLDFHGVESVAIVGRSGSGKSSLIDLLAGFHEPQSGVIAIDGKTTPHLNMAAWQRRIWYIPQKPYIFHGTIADNIRFYAPTHAPTASADQIQRAAEMAGLGDWLATLRDGLNTPIGEGNRAISGGQAQRIALARVTLDSSREILLFDEPTAHLDIETEYELKRTLVQIMRGHLVILATHRLHWLDSVDRVVVLDEGRVVQDGAPRKLLRQPGALSALIGEMGGDHIGG
ncbi:MAG: thiol reductant ABC exporter subunit CydD [Bifidobacterium sp.]|uniref:Thiol reductant ABC exporter subunit CydD n=1 Tax=Bifidobacterium fermentum TaxID=3059035 RepID=A0AB39UPB8_9BIFI